MRFSSRQLAGKADAAVAFWVAGQDAAKKYGISATPVMLYPNSLHFAVQKGKNQAPPAGHRPLPCGRKERSFFLLQPDNGEMVWYKKAGWVIPPYLWWSLAAAAGLVALFVILSVVLGREVRRKTAQLSRQNEELQSEVASRTRAETELVRKNEELVAAYEELTTIEEELRANYQELGKSEQALRQARKKLNFLDTLTSQEIQNEIFSLSRLYRTRG